MIGTTLSHYTITSELGRGGMGIVYRATDTRLNREVALKVLPAAALASPDDRARFFREAQAAAQLHHPHIATVFEIDEADERPFIAMEFIDGETLESVARKGPLKLTDAVRYAGEVADALKAAHAKNIVHRDIKSANVMLSADGRCKVLDFGLAKTTHSTMLTRMGSTLGTVAYMSPEQARGEEVDGRTDLYSLGTMLYEMIAGRLPFAGEYEQAVVYGILNETPEPLTALRTGVPMQLEWIVNKCLAKQAGDRYQTASDLMVDLKNLDLSRGSASTSTSTASMPTMASAPASMPGAAHSAGPKRLPWVVPLAVVIALAAGLVAGYGLFRTEPEPEPLMRSSILLKGFRGVSFPTMSPTGEYMVFRGTDNQARSGVFIRSMDTGAIQFIEGSESVSNRELMFSPDGSRLAFSIGDNQGVATVVVPTGLPEVQTDFGRIDQWMSNTSFLLTDWTAGASTFLKTLGRAELDTLVFDTTGMDPRFVNYWNVTLPGTDILFGHQVVPGPAAQTSRMSLIRSRLEPGSPVEIVESPIVNPRYVPGGYLMYQQRNDDGTLVVRPIDPKTGDFTGQPMPVLPDGELIRWGGYEATPQGDLLLVTGSTVPRFSGGIPYLFDLDAVQAEIIDLVLPNEAWVTDVDYSSDGRKLAMAIRNGSTEQFVAIYDLDDRTFTQITFAGSARSPRWSSDDRWIYYEDRSAPRTVTMRVESRAGATAEVFLEGYAVNDVSPDGRLLAVRDETGSRMVGGIYTYSLSSQEIAPVDTSGGFNARFSPDGRYLAYWIGRMGQPPFLAVSAVATGQRSSIPEHLGGAAAWSPDGTRLYTVGNGAQALPIRLSPSFMLRGEAEPLFTSEATNGMDVSPDGRTMVVVTSNIQTGSVEEDQNVEIEWIQNWADHLKR